MKVPIHYVVRAKLIRFKENDELDFSEFEETFHNKEPIKAREKAFEYYQSIIDVLLEAKNNEYTNDLNARKELKSFYNPDVKINIGGEEVHLNGYGFGLGIFVIIDDSISMDGNEEEWFIHGIGDVGSILDVDDDYLIVALDVEISYYKKWNYSTLDKETQIVYCEKTAWESNKILHPAICTHTILKTPFNWDGYDKPFWWSDEEINEISEPIEKLIETGESNQVEFKPSLVYNFKTKKAGISVKGIIAKAICAFLNSNGGFLMIGINDDGQITGLGNDFKLSGGKNQKDFFLLEFDQMIEHFLSFSIRGNIRGKFYKKNGKEIFVVEVYPSKRRPIFLKGIDGKEFYVRGEASSRRLKDIEEITNYCIDKFIEQ